MRETSKAVGEEPRKEQQKKDLYARRISQRFRQDASEAWCCVR